MEARAFGAYRRRTLRYRLRERVSDTIAVTAALVYLAAIIAASQAGPGWQWALSFVPFGEHAYG